MGSVTGVTLWTIGWLIIVSHPCSILDSAAVAVTISPSLAAVRAVIVEVPASSEDELAVGVVGRTCCSITFITFRTGMLRDIHVLRMSSPATVIGKKIELSLGRPGL